MPIRRTHEAKEGFTLVELMIVVAVLAIITAVAIPGIQQAQRRANEASAIATLKIISAVQNQYRLRFDCYGGFSDLEAAGMLDDAYSDAEKSGYIFSDAAAATPANWAIQAQPITPSVTGNRYFFIDLSGVIRVEDGAVATVASTPLN